MGGWLYLIRNRDLYKIGITRNFENRMRQLKPDNVVAKLYTSDFIKLERELHHRYKNFRIPQTEYFRLEKEHIKEIEQRLSNINYPFTITLLIFIKSCLFLVLTFLFVFISLYLNINDLNNVLLSSILWMERLSICYSFFSVFLHSGYYFNFTNELRYRFSRLVVFLMFAFLFTIASAFIK